MKLSKTVASDATGPHFNYEKDLAATRKILTLKKQK